MSIYSKEWDQQYFNDFFLRKSGNLWDVDAADAVTLDKEIFLDKMNLSLPILDLGCGTGKQSLALSSWFPRVIGIDVSKRAVQIAQTENPGPNIIYEVVDFTIEDSVRRIKSRYGHCNVYMRGVYHQIRSEDAARFVLGVKEVLGGEGLLFFNEVSDQIRDYFKDSQSRFNALPERMRQVFLATLPPNGVNINMLKEQWEDAGYRFILLDTHGLRTNLLFADGKNIIIPSIVGLLKNV